MNDNQVEFWKQQAKSYELLYLEQKNISQEYRKLTDDYHKKLDAERSKREDVNYHKFECKQCHWSAIRYRFSYDKKITCPECGIINDAVL